MLTLSLRRFAYKLHVMSCASKLIHFAVADAFEQLTVQSRAQWLHWLRTLGAGESLCFR
jgi:hypothetical protein